MELPDAGSTDGTGGRVPRLPERWRKLAVGLGIVFVGYVAVMTLVIAVKLAFHAPSNKLTDDISSLAGLPFYTGMFSLLGIKFWAIAGTIALFSGVMLSCADRGLRAGSFFLVAALISFWLGMDDAFRLHETVLPSMLGVDEKLVLAFYVFGMLAFVAAFLGTIRRSEYLLLGIAGFLFAMSLVVDVTESIGPLTGMIYPGIVEDSFKLTGILAWAVYLGHSALGIVLPRLRGPAARLPSQAVSEEVARQAPAEPGMGGVLPAVALDSPGVPHSEAPRLRTSPNARPSKRRRVALTRARRGHTV
ncbi:MAG: hypothetical protein AAGI68_15410 [Planctomycetota bacterium]